MLALLKAAGDLGVIPALLVFLVWRLSKTCDDLKASIDRQGERTERAAENTNVELKRQTVFLARIGERLRLAGWPPETEAVQVDAELRVTARKGIHTHDPAPVVAEAEGGENAAV